MSKKILIILISCLLATQAFCQEYTIQGNRLSHLTNLVNAIFVSQDSLPVVFEKDMVFENNNYPNDKKKEAFIAQAQKIYAQKKNTYLKDSISFVFYGALKIKDKPQFKKEYYDNIGVVLSKDQPLLYVYFQEDKISSFEYISKGIDGPSYFIWY